MKNVLTNMPTLDGKNVLIYVPTTDSSVKNVLIYVPTTDGSVKNVLTIYTHYSTIGIMRANTFAKLSIHVHKFLLSCSYCQSFGTNYTVKLRMRGIMNDHMAHTAQNIKGCL